MAAHEQSAASLTDARATTPVLVEAHPVRPGPAVVARPVVTPCVPGAVVDARPSLLKDTDTLAVASAVCGFTAIVPVVSQVAGLALGVAGLLRIRRARRCGAQLRGRGWAWAGIFSSGFALLCWIAIFAAFAAVGNSFAHTLDALPTFDAPGV